MHIWGLPLLGLVNLVIIYILWSSTFLAIRITVAGEGGIPPFMMGTGRMFVAGASLLIIGYLSKHRLKPLKQEMFVILISSLFIWSGGTALLTWGMQYIQSGLAALITAAVPNVVALINAMISRLRPSLLLVSSLILGFCGMVIIVWPSILKGNLFEITSLIAVIFSAVLCAVGLVIQSRHTVTLSPQVFSGYQLLGSSIVFGSLMLLDNESLFQLSLRVVLAWGYLTIVTGLGVTAFTYILKLLPINIAMTYAYINPVLALFWGWWLLKEEILIKTAFGALMVILAVIGVFKDRTKITAVDCNIREESLYELGD
jgi:drug/metabolite transporter (DMT)-like permease